MEKNVLKAKYSNMYLCSKYNFTLAIIVVYVNNLVIIRDGRKIEGALGVQIQKLLNSKGSLP